ncbi:MAG: Type 1 glutamine amidotransferase-like domain-containing protein [Clostridia bacterium]|nr:Type 1 glutamine amidotransferase-like domain-containing protein [Clostridia bacterium]
MTVSSDILLAAAKKYINGGKAALVVTADNEYKEKNYHVECLTRELQILGLTVEIFDFDVQEPKELDCYDIVEIIGGNPYYLLDSIRKNGFGDVLLDFAENKCLIGCSAGALVLTPTLALVNELTPEMNIVNLRDLSACRLTDICIMPHYSKFIKRYAGLEEKCLKFERESDCRLIRLDDGEAVVIESGKTNIIRK